MLLICSASSMVITRRRANVASCSTNASAKRSRSWANACLKSSGPLRSEEHTSELQSLRHLVCRLLLEKKNIDDCPPTRNADELQINCGEDSLLQKSSRMIMLARHDISAIVAKPNRNTTIVALRTFLSV